MKIFKYGKMILAGLLVLCLSLFLSSCQKMKSNLCSHPPTGKKPAPKIIVRTTATAKPGYGQYKIVGVMCKGWCTVQRLKTWKPLYPGRIRISKNTLCLKSRGCSSFVALAIRPHLFLQRYFLYAKMCQLSSCF